MNKINTNSFVVSDGHYLAACVRDDTIKIIDLHNNQILTTLSHDNYKVGCDFARIAFNADSSHVAAGAADGSVYIWNANGVLVSTLKDHTWVFWLINWWFIAFNGDNL